MLERDTIAEFVASAPRQALAYIISHKPTCEDLTLHFHNANATQLPPVQSVSYGRDESQETGDACALRPCPPPSVYSCGGCPRVKRVPNSPFILKMCNCKIYRYS